MKAELFGYDCGVAGPCLSVHICCTGSINFLSSLGTCWLAVCEDELMSWFKVMD